MASSLAPQRATRLKSAQKLVTALEGFFTDELRELDTISQLADELSVVALYRVVELNTARILVYEFGPMVKKKASRVDGVKDLLLKNIGLKLETVPHYRAVNELRLLNNAIKHEGKVTRNLSKGYKRLRPKVPTYILRLAERMKLKYKS